MKLRKKQTNETQTAEEPVDTEKADRDARRAALHGHETEGGLVGAFAGAAVGAIGGPPGVIAGAVIGAAAGALSGVAMDAAIEERDAEDAAFDRDIGVTEGDLGAPDLLHPPPTLGAYSVASSGGAGIASPEGEDEPAEGPMQTPA